MPTLKNVSARTWQDLRREDSREFSAEEMNSPEVKRALRMGLLIEGPDDRASETRQPQQRPPQRR
jgi:hypothetical protein